MNTIVIDYMTVNLYLHPTESNIPVITAEADERLLFNMPHVL
jgi:hypothetical protein